MPQYFRPSSNTLTRAALVGGVLGLATFAGALTAYNLSSYATHQYIPIEQPVPFSHQHHVQGLGMDCRYCHTGVEESHYAGVPPTHTCMTCHSQLYTDAAALEPVRASYISNQPIQWNRVHFLPEFVYFNHSIHVQKGVGCETCHGRVDQMPITWKAKNMTMSWCLDCHRHPEKFLRPQKNIYDMGYQPPINQITLGNQLKGEYHVMNAQKLTDCYTCHR